GSRRLAQLTFSASLARGWANSDWTGGHTMDRVRLGGIGAGERATYSVQPALFRLQAIGDIDAGKASSAARGSEPARVCRCHPGESGARRRYS
ncbi:MAG: hypothetical protein ACE5JX_19965, partial [Acidobacteriota bacterium]